MAKHAQRSQCRVPLNNIIVSDAGRDLHVARLTCNPGPGIVDKEDVPVLGVRVDQHDALREAVHGAYEACRLAAQSVRLLFLRSSQAPL